MKNIKRCTLEPTQGKFWADSAETQDLQNDTELVTSQDLDLADFRKENIPPVVSVYDDFRKGPNLELFRLFDIDKIPLVQQTGGSYFPFFEEEEIKINYMKSFNKKKKKRA